MSARSVNPIIAASVGAIAGVGLFLAGGLTTYLIMRNQKTHAPLAARAVFNREETHQRWIQIIKGYEVSLDEMNRMIAHFEREMTNGLASENSDSTLPMIPTFVGRATGKEHGKFYALDLGGTNFRVISVELQGDGIIGAQRSLSFTIGDFEMNGTSDDLFKFIASKVNTFMVDEEKDTQKNIGFTFSFPVKQLDVASGTLIGWTKGFTTSGVEGKDVVALAQDQIDQSVENTTIKALANDTVGTMVAATYEDPDVYIGLILGTGTNAAYIEKVSEIKKFNTKTDLKEMAVNIEWGAFGDNKELYPRMRADIEIDQHSPNPGKQWFEKMISGMYLGEIARRTIIQCIEVGALFDGSYGNNRIREPGNLKTKYVSSMVLDSSATLQHVALLMHKKFGFVATLRDKERVKQICKIVFRRAARFTAAGIAAVVRRIGKPKCTVAIDGSVYEKNPYSFRVYLRQALAELFPKDENGKRECEVELILSKDGSGIGAAIIAATV